MGPFLWQAGPDCLLAGGEKRAGLISKCPEGVSSRALAFHGLARSPATLEGCYDPILQVSKLRQSPREPLAILHLKNGSDDCPSLQQVCWESPGGESCEMRR